MKKLIAKLSLFLFAAFMAFPLLGHAADPEDKEGTIKIIIVDQFGKSVKGDWYLHQAGLNGLTLRNGISDDDFGMKAGNYYLEVRFTATQKAYVLDIDPYQNLEIGETLTYKIRYYADNEAKAIGPITPLSSEEAQPEPAPVAPTPVAPVTPKPTPVVPPAPVAPSVNVPTFETAPRPTVRTFNMVPEIPEIEIGALGGGALSGVPQLATTGISFLGLLLPSIAGGLLLTRRKKII